MPFPFVSKLEIGPFTPANPSSDSSSERVPDRKTCLSASIPLGLLSFAGVRVSASWIVLARAGSGSVRMASASCVKVVRSCSS